MKNQFQALLFFFLIPFVSISQEIETKIFNGQTFQKITGDYYLLDDVGQELIPVGANQISLIYHEGATAQQMSLVESEFNLSFVNVVETGWYDYTLDSVYDLIDQVSLIQNSTAVKLVEVWTKPQFNLTPNDSAVYEPFNQVWHSWAIPQTGLNLAWNKTTGDSSIVAAILDSGVDWWHEDFAQATNTTGNMWVNPGEDAWTDPNDPSTGDQVDNDGNGFVDDWRGWNFVDNSNDVRDYYPSTWYHGTSVAGIIAARTNNYLGLTGVAGGWGANPGVKLMIVKLGAANSTTSIVSGNADNGIIYAAKQGAQIINMSLSFYSNHASINAAIKLAYEKYNCVIVASSGNDSTIGKPVNFPANEPQVLGVAISNQVDRAYKSHTGPRLDLLAPGDNMPILKSPGNQYEVNLGTSLAAPFVAGLAGLMLSINPCLDNEEVYNILKRRADKVHEAGSSSYDYNWNPVTPGHSKVAGYGRVNAEEVVNTAEAMKQNSLDLYIKDHYNDFGYPNSYPATTFYSDWSDIWVRNQQDGHTHREMDQIKYVQGQNVYVYVRVRNKSCVASTTADRLKVYWTKFSSVSSWPQNWDGSQPNKGDQIADVAIPALAAGDDTILEFSWAITADTAHWGRCIMARIVSANDPITSYASLAQEIRYNNNIAIRNLTILHTKAGSVGPNYNSVQYPDGRFGLVGLPNDGNSGPVDIKLDVPYQAGGASLFEDAEIRLFVDEAFWSIINNMDPADLVGLEISDEKELRVTAPHAVLQNVQFSEGQRCVVYLGFNFLTDEVDTIFTYRYHLSQYRDGELDGGMHYTILRDERDDFEADAGPDQFIYEGQSAQLNAADINEAATYNWYDTNDSLVYTGKSPTLAPAISEKYKLEVVATADLYKDYDEVEIKVNPYAITSLTPNPASTNLVITYDADEANSAYFILQPISGGGSSSFIISTNQNQKTINVNSFTSGVYALLLVCDGMVVDSEMLTIY